MSNKSFKLKNNNYWDISSIVYGHTQLKDMFEENIRTLIVNDTYVYNTDFNYQLFQIGKIVFLHIGTIAFKRDVPNYQAFLSGLPPAKQYFTSYLTGGLGATNDVVRVGITSEGTMQTHWGSPNCYGDSANKQYTGTIIYEAQ